MKKFYPEGYIFEKTQIKEVLKSASALQSCFVEGRILEARATYCDKDHNLHVDLGVMQGVIPREECALGIAEGTVRDIAILSRVNKPVCFKIIDFLDDESGIRTAILSRRAVQKECMENYIEKLVPGDVIDARVTHNESFGAFCDIGCGISALMPIDSISVSRIPHPDDRFSVSTKIKAVVKSIDCFGRVTLSHKELLGTWEENASNFNVGQTVGGVIRAVESYGVFVELAPNLSGLAESTDQVKSGDYASVYIKSINPEKMKIKLALVDSFSEKRAPVALQYFYEGEHIDYWRYSPEKSAKIIESIF